MYNMGNLVDYTLPDIFAWFTKPGEPNHNISSFITNRCWLHSTYSLIWTRVKQLLLELFDPGPTAPPGERAAGQGRVSYVWGRNTARESSNCMAQEVTLMKNSVVCCSWRPSGMNKVRPRQREKTWAQLETTHRPTAEEHTHTLG